MFRDNRGLLDAFRQGRRRALETVYRFYVDLVWRIARWGFAAGAGHVPGAPDEAAALDYTQDVFIKAFSEKARLAYDGLRPYRPFIARIARNHLVDRHRTRHEVNLSAEALEAVLHDDAAPAPPPAAEDSLDRSRLREATRAFIAQADAELARFVDLRFVEEQSQYEVCAALGLTRRRVRTLEKRALEGLRAHLARSGLLELAAGAAQTQA